PEVAPLGIAAEHRDVAPGPLPVALQDLHRRGLPRAIRAEEAEDLPAGDVERDPLDGLDAVVTLAQLTDRDGRLGHAPNYGNARSARRRRGLRELYDLDLVAGNAG